MLEKRWRICGYHSANVIFDRRIPYADLTEHQARELLARLASRHLMPDEIIASSLKSGAGGRAIHLEVQIATPENGSFGLMTTGNPFYTASVEEA